ncbi:MAG: hypothetical protein JOZ22_22215 [Acidobacteriia bacterium]|nr:hypothetical protein [Terriglobia bacterium]
MNDLRLGLRIFGKNPLAALAVAALLALGIGASTTIFSLFDAVLLRPLPVRNPFTSSRSCCTSLVPQTYSR